MTGAADLTLAQRLRVYSAAGAHALVRLSPEEAVQIASLMERAAELDDFHARLGALGEQAANAAATIARAQAEADRAGRVAIWAWGVSAVILTWRAALLLLGVA